MKSISIILVILLTTIIVWQQKKLNTFEIKYQHQRDTINNIYIQNLETREKTKFYSKINEPEHLDFATNDTIIEVHRIMQSWGNRYRLFKVELYKDSTVKLTFKLASIQNPFTGENKDSLYKTHVQILDKKIWNNFKDSFSKIESYDLTHWNGMADCFDGGLSWEANINNRTYHYGTHCRQVAQFTNACEIIMRQVQDKDLQNRFKEIDKLLNR